MRSPISKTIANQYKRTSDWCDNLYVKLQVGYDGLEGRGGLWHPTQHLWSDQEAGGGILQRILAAAWQF